MGELINLAAFRAAREDEEKKQTTDEELNMLRSILSQIIENLPEEPGTGYVSSDPGEPFILPQTNLDGYYPDDDTT